MQVQIVKSENGEYRIKVTTTLGGLPQTYGRIYTRGARQYLGVWREFSTRSYWRALLECFYIWTEGSIDE